MADAKTLPDGETAAVSRSDFTAGTVVIYGAGGLAREVLQLINDMAAAGAPVACTGFLVDPGFFPSDRIGALPVHSSSGVMEAGEAVVIAIGSPAARRRIAERIGGAARFATLIHPRATVGDSVVLGSGSIACAGAVATVDIRIGSHVQLHVNCTIGHDVVLGDCSTIAPGANVGGGTVVGVGAFVGSGAVILPRVRLGAWSIVGAGAVVTADVPANATVVGVPATVIAQRAAGWQLGCDHGTIEQAYAGARRGALLNALPPLPPG
jgi:sugar O-acyltransferase (sialic acid O-acetyltransferase NeuD family)